MPLLGSIYLRGYMYDHRPGALVAFGGRDYSLGLAFKWRMWPCSNEANLIPSRGRIIPDVAISLKNFAAMCVSSEPSHIAACGEVFTASTLYQT